MLKLFAANPYNITANQIGLPTGNGDVSVILVKATQTLMLLVGMLAIIFLLVGGLQMVYSNGDAARVKRAKDTLLYAVVGLVMAIAAFAIVTFITTRVK